MFNNSNQSLKGNAMTKRFSRAIILFGLAIVVAACGGGKDNKPADAEKKDTSGSASSSSTEAAKGMELASADGRFKVMIPEGFANPQESTMPLTTAVGTLNMKVFTAAKGDAAVFMTAYVDYPEEAFANGTDVMLDGAREGAMKNLNGTVDRQESITLDGNPGRSVTFSGKSQGIDVYGRVDYYIAKPRLYQILYLSQSKDGLDDESIKNGFSSFAITK